MACFPDVWAPYQLSIFTSVISAIIAVVAIIGNTLICIAVFKDPLKKLRSPFAYFLVNLAVSDLIVGAINQPISVYVHATEAQGYLPSTLAKLIHMTYFISATASILSLLALCLDRYLAIAHAIKYRVYLDWRKCILISIIIWFISLTLPFIYFEFGYIDYLMFHCHTSVVAALVGLIATYIRIYLYLRRQSNQLAALQRTSSTVAEEMRLQRLKTEKKVTRTFLWILLLFIATYAPAIIMIYILHFCESCNCDFRHALRDLQFLLISSNSCMNPFVCTIRLKQFRKSMVALLPHRCVFSKSVEIVASQNTDVTSLPDIEPADNNVATVSALPKKNSTTA